MSQYLLINRLTVQNANAVAGFTWGFPAITHFLGFAHNLSRKLHQSDFNDCTLSGCGVVAHEHHVHVYASGSRFTQSKNPAYLQRDAREKVAKGKAPTIIEEAKMNMTVSLLIGFDGYLGNQESTFLAWLEKQCLLQRLAGGTILNIESIELFDMSEDKNVYVLKRQLLPGFVLMDRSAYLQQHLEQLQIDKPDAECIDAWLDFSALKHRARPKTDVISKHLNAALKAGTLEQSVVDAWQAHLADRLYQSNACPDAVKAYFVELEANKANKAVLDQWQHYLQPTEKTPADWEYVPKPFSGFLVPIMVGYKAISPVYANKDVANTRDSKTQVCFVESAHSVGEWQSVNRLRNAEDFKQCLWHYHYEEHWFLCRQPHTDSTEDVADNDLEIVD